jgi:hypothetical protein
MVRDHLYGFGAFSPTETLLQQHLRALPANCAQYQHAMSPHVMIETPSPVNEPVWRMRPLHSRSSATSFQWL